MTRPAIFLAGSPKADLASLTIELPASIADVGAISTVPAVLLVIVAITALYVFVPDTAISTASPTLSSGPKSVLVPVIALFVAIATVPVSAVIELEATVVFPDARLALVGPQRETLILFPNSPAYFAEKSPCAVTGVPSCSEYTA